jgi:hypothetical protein
MAGVARHDIDVVQLYDCYTITVLLTIEDAGFCEKGEGMAFVREHDLTWRETSPPTPAAGNLASPGVRRGWFLPSDRGSPADPGHCSGAAGKGLRHRIHVWNGRHHE